MYDAMTFINRMLQETGGAPTRSHNKVASGRSRRKQANSQRTLNAVGGFRSTITAISQPSGTAMCRVVPNSTGRLSDGTPFRSPGR